MLFDITHEVHISSSEEADIHPQNDLLSPADLRRQMYERMARGSALIEAEETACRKWRGR